MENVTETRVIKLDVYILMELSSFNDQKIHSTVFC